MNAKYSNQGGNRQQNTISKQGGGGYREKQANNEFAQQKRKKFSDEPAWYGPTDFRMNDESGTSQADFVFKEITRDKRFSSLSEEDQNQEYARKGSELTSMRC